LRGRGEGGRERKKLSIRKGKRKEERGKREKKGKAITSQ